jgi:hypothetical protein
MVPFHSAICVGDKVADHLELSKTLQSPQIFATRLIGRYQRL